MSSPSCSLLVSHGLWLVSFLQVMTSMSSTCPMHLVLTATHVFLLAIGGASAGIAIAAHTANATWGAFALFPVRVGEGLMLCTCRTGRRYLPQDICRTIPQRLINNFIDSHDPCRIMDVEKIFPSCTDATHGTISAPLSLVSTCKDMHCLSASPLTSSLVVDSGASVCIFPHKEDFVAYGASTMKIKDLSSSNMVTREGIISWRLGDVTGSTVIVEVKGYHIPHANIWLLSPQVLLSTIGGSSLQTTGGVDRQ